MIIPLLINIILLIIVILFHSCMIAGAPWGEYTMGGSTKGPLPAKMRIGSGISILVLVFFIYFTLVFTRIIEAQILYSENFKYIILGFNMVSVVMNGITKSSKERNLWLPVCLGLAITSVILFL